jgi:hypothetical protein
VARDSRDRTPASCRTYLKRSETICQRLELPLCTCLINLPKDTEILSHSVLILWRPVYTRFALTSTVRLHSRGETIMPFVSKGTTTTLLIFAAMLVLAAVPASAQELYIINRIFANVPVTCGGGFAYQSYEGANCSNPTFPQQSLDGVAGIGWSFREADPTADSGSGITNANTGFNPPPFTGFPFSQAAFLRGNHTEISQAIDGFLVGTGYRLYFYLGSRYYDGPADYDGNQTVAVLIDNRLIGSWNLSSFTPFTLETLSFEVSSSGTHVLKFVGVRAGDHTAFLSGVSLQAVSE